MNGFELKVPMRLYWDISPNPAGPVPDVEAVCRDILDLKILSINLLDLNAEPSDATLRVLAALKGKASVALTLSSRAFDFSPFERLAQLGAKALLVHSDSLGGLRSVPFSRMPRDSAVGVSFDVTSANWRELPEVVRLCCEHQINILSLPMQRLIHQGNIFFLNPEEKRTLLELLHSQPLPPLKFTIHDPFLWRMFFPDVSFPDGGCQAGNTMAYVSPDGGVFPCPSLPISIGSLLESPLRDIVMSAAKAELRSRILGLPTGCADCALLLQCNGGCRGRAAAYHGVLDSPDPGCLV